MNVQEYIKITQQLHDSFSKHFTNMLAKENYINGIKATIRDTFDAQDAYVFERTRESEHVAFARILNIYGDDIARSINRTK